MGTAQGVNGARSVGVKIGGTVQSGLDLRARVAFANQFARWTWHLRPAYYDNALGLASLHKYFSDTARPTRSASLPLGMLEKGVRGVHLPTAHSRWVGGRAHLNPRNS